MDLGPKPNQSIITAQSPGFIVSSNISANKASNIRPEDLVVTNTGILIQTTMFSSP